MSGQEEQCDVAALRFGMGRRRMEREEDGEVRCGTGGGEGEGGAACRGCEGRKCSVAHYGAAWGGTGRAVALGVKGRHGGRMEGRGRAPCGMEEYGMWR